MARGFFICFEGSEGAGKSTQIKKLAFALRQIGHKVLVTREPGGTAVGDELRTLFKTQTMAPLTEIFIIEASRAQHCEEVILPALKKGVTVLCDRFSDSSLVYQGLVRGLPLALVRNLNAIATKKLKPDLTFWLDLRAKNLKKRMAKRSRGDRFDSAGRRFHEKIQESYRKLYRGKTKGIKRIQADQDIEKIHKFILSQLPKRLSTSGKGIR